MTYLKLNWNLPGANELTSCVCTCIVLFMTNILTRVGMFSSILCIMYIYINYVFIINESYSQFSAFVLYTHTQKGDAILLSSLTYWGLSIIAAIFRHFNSSTVFIIDSYDDYNEHAMVSNNERRGKYPTSPLSDWDLIQSWMENTLR